MLLAVAVVLGGLPNGFTAPGARAQEQDEANDEGEQHVIVVLKDGEDPEAAASEMGIQISHIYSNVFTGFAGILPADTPAEVAATRARRKVKEISLDGKVIAEAQVVPSGVTRAGVPYQDSSDSLDIEDVEQALQDEQIGIAVLDTGISTLSDLNVQGGYSCLGNEDDWEDDNGHGTHIAGIAAAEDNASGVVGVAPGARLYAVKVLNAQGSGSFSDIICGLEWVLDNADVVDVVNLSLSGEDEEGTCNEPALHEAVCAVVDAGITVVAAAGNQGINAKERVPASYDDVIAVSAICDLDGQPGHLASGTCDGNRDDVFADFSNYGGAVDIAAPGGCVLSYSGSGSLVEVSGTSQASPHVAGAAADFIALHAADNGGDRPSPEQVRSWLLNEASRSQSADGVTGDPDSAAAKKKAKKAAIKKAKKKLQKAKGKKSKQRAKKQLKQAKRKSTKAGQLEPVLWLEVLG